VVSPHCGGKPDSIFRNHVPNWAGVLKDYHFCITLGLRDQTAPWKELSRSINEHALIELYDNVRLRFRKKVFRIEFAKLRTVTFTLETLALGAKKI
jgi:hypothetical protein